MDNEIQAGDLMYARSQLQEIANRTPEGTAELASLKVTTAWLNEQASKFPPNAITEIPPVRP